MRTSEVAEAESMNALEELAQFEASCVADLAEVLKVASSPVVTESALEELRMKLADSQPCTWCSPPRLPLESNI